MAKSRKISRTSKLLKSIGKTTKSAVPVIKSGLKTIGSKTVPIVKKGAENVYGALKTGFDLGINSLAKLAKKSRKRRRH